MKVIQSPGGLIKAWTDGVSVEDEALVQVYNLRRLPFIHKWVALMPDVHKGIGATVGSVIATSKAIVPAAVGVDIGCGMSAVRLKVRGNPVFDPERADTLRAEWLPDNLRPLREAIERAVPHGRDPDKAGGEGDPGVWSMSSIAPRALNTGEVMLKALHNLLSEQPYGPRHLAAQHPGMMPGKPGSIVYQMGTLGTGNHFIEVCLDEEGNVWVMLHSGSRGVGNRIGTYFISEAKKQAERYGYAGYLPDLDLAWLNEDTPIFNDYIAALTWAQNYAAANRAVMMAQVLDAISVTLGYRVEPDFAVIDCHHNYAVKEHHYGKNVWVTRKGAVRARSGDLGIIPGSMGTRSYIVRGKGQAEAFMSCSHGAGRRMSRTEAKRQFTLRDHELATAGVECRKDSDVLDETPGAYKDIDAVIAAEKDLVDVEHTLKQVLCVKG